MASVKILTTCDFCRSKKLRCIKQQPSDTTCTECVSRAQHCHYSQMKQRSRRVREVRPRDRTPARATSSGAGLSPSLQRATLDAQATVDHNAEPRTFGSQEALTTPDSIESMRAMNVSTRRDKIVRAGGATCFSDNLIARIDAQLGDARFSQLIYSIEAASTRSRAVSIKALMTAPSGTTASLNDDISEDQRRIYVDCYFKEIHPAFPFLDRPAVEALLALDSSQLDEYLSANDAWAAIYYTVLSLGCLLHEPGSFAPLEGPSWKIFRHAMRLFPYILIAQPSLAALQAITTMALFPRYFSNWVVEELLITEAARLCVALRVDIHDQFSTDAETYSRTFWTVYCLEREYSFHSSQSLLIGEEGIICPLPRERPGEDEDLSLFTRLISLCRLTATSYSRLFTAAALRRPRTQLLEEIDHIRDSVESWRQAYPQDCRPGKPPRSRSLDSTGALMATLHHHCLYHLLLISLARLDNYLSAKDFPARRIQAGEYLTGSARAIINLTQQIPIEHSTPMNILAGAPIIATFVLFDHMVRNVDDPDYSHNQAFLEIITGYWLRFAMASELDSLGRSLARFSGISRDLLAVHQKRAAGDGPDRASHIQHSDGFSCGDLQPAFYDMPEVDLSFGIANIDETFDPTLATDPWSGNWGFDEEMNWTNVIGRPSLQS